MENNEQFEVYCTDSLEVVLLKPRNSLVGEYVVTVEKTVAVDIYEAQKFAIATFCYYYDYNSSTELFSELLESLDEVPLRKADRSELFETLDIKKKGFVVSNNTLCFYERNAPALREILALLAIEKNSEFSFIFVVSFS